MAGRNVEQVAGPITNSVPSSISTAARPDTTSPTCSTWQRSSGPDPTCSDHRHPGS
jgi:hypothetical protein